MPAIAEMPDLSDAMARLEAAEASETSIAQTELTQPEPSEEPQATPLASDGAEAPKPISTDTPSAADAKPAEAAEKKTDVETKPDATPKPGEKQSKFKADQQRRDDSWKKLNEEKAELKAQRDQFTTERNALQQERTRLQVDRARVNQRYTPEQYEQAATNKLAGLSALELQADGLESRAQKLEDEGKSREAGQARDKAQDIREQIAAEKHTAKQMQGMAAHLRANPDKTLEQHKAEMARQKQHYLVEAAKKWPELGQDKSPFQQKMAGMLQNLRQRGFDANEHPALFYDVARLVAAETAAERVPGMETELGQLRARVKELEALTAPGGGSAAVQQMPAASAKTDADEEAELRQMAVGLS
jgi:hypothetical protein